jgi:hypothetical protein
MKKLSKIDNKNIDRVLSHIKNSGPTRNIFDSDRHQEYFLSNEALIEEIKRFLEQERFSPQHIFLPERTEGNMSDSPPWLGSYKRMRSPGVITLNVSNITNFAWYICSELLIRDHEITTEVFDQIAYNVTYKTIYHELFHHYTDFVRIFTDGRSQYDFYIEEALAVAFSRIYLGIENNNLPLYTDLFSIAYDYKGPGYCNWKDYQSEQLFIRELIEYSAYPALLGATEKKNLFKICQANLEAIVNYPNVIFELN